MRERPAPRVLVLSALRVPVLSELLVSALRVLVLSARVLVLSVLLVSALLAAMLAVLTGAPVRSLAQSTAQPPQAQDNLGTEFYIAYGPNEGGEGTWPTVNLMALYITSRTVAHGKVEVPALNFFKTFTTVPGQITVINLPSGNQGGPTVEITADESIVKGMAVHVSSDSEVAVFGMNHKRFSSDAFMALPLDVLGTEYRTMNYRFSPVGGGETPGEFWIVGVEDSTNVTVTPRDATKAGYPAGSKHSFILGKGETYLVQGATDPQNDLTGSLVEADRPIAVFTGHMRTQIPFDAVNSDGTPSRDHLVEQLPPVSAWGDSALVVPYATSDAPDLVRIVSSEDGNDVKVNGTSVATLNAGDFYEITQLTGVTSIEASKPILVGQYLHTSEYGFGGLRPAYGDPALALVFPVEQFTTSYTILSIVDPSSFAGNFVNIVAPADAVSTMQLDGQAIDPAEFRTIPGSKFVYAQHRLEQGTHNLTAAKPFGVTVYALGNVDSYAYTGGTLLKAITPLKTVALAIDFGDRVLDANLNGRFDTIVDLENVSQDVVNIFGFPRRSQDTSKFHVVDPPTDPQYTLQPGEKGHMTIEFEPREVNRRMHTQITAKTDHLRAYVVDVYGRGVKDELGLFSDATKVTPVTEVDFGIWANTDPPVDTTIFIGNAGLASLTLTSDAITGANSTDFAMLGYSRDGATQTIPFSVALPPSPAVALKLRFIPSGANGPRTAQYELTSSSGTKRIVILKATVQTVQPLTTSETSIAFDSTLVCHDQPIDIHIPNANPLPVTVTTANISGVNAGDFVILTPVPLTIPANTTGTITLQFQPTGTGLRTAQAELAFDLPKNAAPAVVPLRGIAGIQKLEFASSKTLTTDGSNTFLVPIYPREDLTPFAAVGYTIHVSYDSLFLQLQDVETANTLTPFGYVSLFSGPGRDTIYFSSANNTPIVGGGASSTTTGGSPLTGTPLIYLKFAPKLPAGVDPWTFDSSFDIAYDVDLTSSAIPVTCLSRTFTGGRVQVLSVCSTPHLTPESNGLPQQMMLGLASPDPFRATTTIEYDVAAPGGNLYGSNRGAGQGKASDVTSLTSPQMVSPQVVPVKIEVTNSFGEVVRTLVDEPKPTGYYSATLSGTGLPPGSYFVTMTAGSYARTRKVVLVK